MDPDILEILVAQEIRLELEVQDMAVPTLVLAPFYPAVAAAAPAPAVVVAVAVVAAVVPVAAAVVAAATATSSVRVAMVATVAKVVPVALAVSEFKGDKAVRAVAVVVLLKFLSMAD